MDGGSLYLPAVGGVAAPAVRVVGCQNFYYVTRLVLFAAGAGDEVRALQAALGAAGIQALVLGHRLLQEVLRFHVQLTGEGDGAGAVLGAVGVILYLEGLALALGIVGDGQLHRADHRHDALGGFVQVLPKAMLKEGELHGAGCLGYADAFAEIPDGGRGIAPPPQAAEGGHPGIVPAGDPAVLYQSAKLPLAHDGVVDTQTGELDLPGSGGQVAMLHHPVVQRTVGLKLQRAEAVGDALHGVLDGVGEVIHGIDAPLVPLPVMVHMVDPVDHRVTHIEVAAGGVDFSPQGHGPVGKLTGAHPGKEVQTLLDGAAAVGALSGGVHVAPHLPHLVGGQLADVGQALPDEGHGALVHLLKVVGGVEKPVPPVEA